MLTPFVGRDDEIALLLERWRRAVKGEGQVVMLSGEAGIGKSRIVASLRERISGERHLMLRYQCSPHHINDAFSSRHRPGLACPRVSSAVSRRMCGSTSWRGCSAIAGVPIEEIAPFHASLLAIPTGKRYPPLDLPPGELKERTIAALIAPVVALARQTPLLMILEDAHWIDPTSLDLTIRMVEMVRHMPVLWVMTFRPEFSPPWAGREHVTRRLAQPPRAAAAADDGRWRCERKEAACGSAGPDPGQDRRRAAVRRGTDQECAGVGTAARRARRLCAGLRADTARDSLDPARTR